LRFFRCFLPWGRDSFLSRGSARRRPVLPRKAWAGELILSQFFSTGPFRRTRFPPPLHLAFFPGSHRIPEARCFDGWAPYTSAFLSLHKYKKQKTISSCQISVNHFPKPSPCWCGHCPPFVWSDAHNPLCSLLVSKINRAGTCFPNLVFLAPRPPKNPFPNRVFPLFSFSFTLPFFPRVPRRPPTFQSTLSIVTSSGFFFIFSFVPTGHFQSLALQPEFDRLNEGKPHSHLRPMS